ncbi:hypothetical protein QR680_012082 [Steinernema hermaphroditum]|uniref:Uncharacterized protein n=1 Tax=Steinernema hermaphroditum TaxID=289476 RepID=A0AA39I0U5_9BILA|nr:hypothetical protein QR680_012082 [Steinernema hermaphroditum]
METPKKKKNTGILKRLSQLVHTPRGSPSSSSKSTETPPKRRAGTRSPAPDDGDEEWIRSLRESVEESYRLAERELELRFAAEKQLARLRRSHLDLTLRFLDLQQRSRTPLPPRTPFRTPQTSRQRRLFREEPPPYRPRSSSYHRIPQPEPEGRLYETDL